MRKLSIMEPPRRWMHLAVLAVVTATGGIVKQVQSFVILPPAINALLAVSSAGAAAEEIANSCPSHLSPEQCVSQ
jgi:hypothetical protein